MADKLKYTSKDYQSILKDLISVSPRLSQAYDPQSENDPATFLLKNMALLGDMLSFYLDKLALETAPATMTQRKVADAYYRMIGYYMSWYRPAHSKITISNSSDYIVRIPKYTEFVSIDGSTRAVLLDESSTSIPASKDGKNGERTIEVYEGTLIKEDLGSRLNIVNNKYRMGALSKTLYIDSVSVIDSSGSEWTRVEDISKYPHLGKFYDVYADEYDQLWIRFSPYINETPVSISEVKYIASAGVNSTIIIGSLNGGLIVVPNPKDYPRANANNLKIIDTQLSPVATKGPETPQEAYVNSQLYINTADTLVTIGDYQNAIRRIDEISNCVVTDSVIEEAIKKQPADSNNEGYLDGLTYKVRWIFENFDYDSASELEIKSLISNKIEELKSINLNYKISLDYYICTWMPQGTITLSESVNQDEADELIAKICRKLAEDYHPRKVSFGERISLVDLVAKIKSYDSRILLVDIKPIQYKITNPSKDSCDDDIAQLYIDYINGNENGLSPKIVNDEGVEYSLRHWTKYNSYDSLGNANIMSGIRADAYVATNSSDMYEKINTEATVTGPLNPTEEKPVIELDPSDFFDSTHPYRRISIARFASYEYYNGNSTALANFKNNVKINKENIK